MTNYSQTSNPETFPSFASLRAAHSELLKEHRQTELTPKLLTEVKTFLLRGRTTGALLDTEDERWAAQSLLDYWTSILYRQGEEPPDTTLVEETTVDCPDTSGGEIILWPSWWHHWTHLRCLYWEQWSLPSLPLYVYFNL